MVLRTQQLNALAMELGNAILATMPVDGSKNLSSVDENGKGALDAAQCFRGIVVRE